VTMLDDDRLASLLSGAAGAFEVPASGVEDILTRAAGPALGPAADDTADDSAVAGDQLPDPVREGRAHRLVALTGRHRVLSAAACIVVALVVAGTVGALVRTPSGPTLTSGLPRTAHAAPLAPAGGVTTTVPNGLAAPFGGNSPSPSSASKGTASRGLAQGKAGGAAVTTPTAPSLPGGAVGQPPRIEQTGTLGLTVGRGDLARTLTKLTALAVGNGGFVASSQAQSGAGTSAPYGTITLQVPVANFSPLLKQAQVLGKTSDLTTKATDVTGLYVDLQARIAALQTSRQAYLTILARATTVGDVLSVQEQLDTIQQQIEQLQGQLQVLTSETSYSTLTVTVSEGSPAPRPVPLPESGLVRAWHDSIGGFVAGVEGVVRVAGPVLFALLCLVIVLVGGRALWRRYQRHNL
jgi:hypothetical protein